MATLVKYKVEKLHFPIDGIYNYDVQEWRSVDNGKTWWYCGYGRYCQTLKEANEYVRFKKGEK